MVFYRLSYFIVLLVMLSCGHKHDQAGIDAVKATVIKPPDKNAAIYDFMAIMISDQNLNKGQRLLPMAENEIGMINSSSVFDILLIDTVKQKTVRENRDWKTLHIEASFGPSRCLKTADIAFMQQQQKELSNFTWDVPRMGFTVNDTSHWYVFSIPLFSLDSTKVLVTIRNLCKGLCGSGQTFLYQKEKGKWASSALEMWYH